MSSSLVASPDLFKGFVPLNALRPDSQAELAKKSSVVGFAAGQIVFKAGDAAANAYFLLQGEIAMEDAAGKPLGTVRAGQPNAFHSLANQSPRRVTARCVDAVQCLSMDAALLDVMLTWDQTGTFEVGELSGDGDYSADDWMGRLLQMRTFQLVPPSNLQAMFMRMQEVEGQPGQVIVRQDDEGDYFYVLIEGRCIVTRAQPGQKAVRLAELEPGACFGEEALISEARRNASVTLLTRGRLMRLAKDDFRKLLNEPLTRKLGFEPARQMVAAGKAQWLDVRLPSEYQNHHLADSLSIPLYMLRMRLNQLLPQMAYICVCDTGRRSSVASFILTQKGFDAYVLDKGLPPKAA
jgi:CRP-like cAMP-binding protein